MKSALNITLILTLLLILSCGNDCKKLKKEYAESDAFRYSNYQVKSYWRLEEIGGNDTINVVYTSYKNLLFNQECSFLSHKFSFGIGDDSIRGVSLQLENYITSGIIPKISFNQSILDTTINTYLEYNGSANFDLNISTPSNNYISLHFLKNYSYNNTTYLNTGVFRFNINSNYLYIKEFYLTDIGPVKVVLSDGREFSVFYANFTKVNVDRL